MLKTAAFYSLFFSRIRRRAAYHCIKKKKIVKSLQRGPKGAPAHLNRTDYTALGNNRNTRQKRATS